MASPCCNGVDYRKRFNSRSSTESSSEDSAGNLSAEQPSIWYDNMSVRSMDNLFDGNNLREEDPALALVYVYGDWISPPRVSMKKDPATTIADRMQTWLRSAVKGLECQAICGKLILTEDSVDDLSELPPADLPALAIASQKGYSDRSTVKYLPIKPATLVEALSAKSRNSTASIAVKRTIENAVRQIESDLQLTVTFEESQKAIRIFVAGDRSSVGKSSVCLGLLGNLLTMGYAPSDLAYIKPATQSESTQLIQIYCDKKGVACVPIGPLVYYRGFTRAFLAGETAPTDELLAACGSAVDRLARGGKRVILMDGVGFPAVGSICGTDNAAVALACSYPLENGTRKPAGVLLVGGSGVGSAVDAFNLNATYFERANMPVMGAIFNKLSTDEESFYSMENCKEQVSKYFEQSEHQRRWNRRPFGFCPLYDKLKGEGGAQTLAHADEWIKIFGDHVDVASILQAAQRIKSSPNLPAEPLRAFKRPKVDHNDHVLPRPRVVMSRQEIEEAAIRSGAPISA